MLYATEICNESKHTHTHSNNVIQKAYFCIKEIITGILKIRMQQKEKKKK